MPKSRTPIIKPRTQGGTFYTFASALEDVGLNINELKNKVSLSHYVLLNIPAFDAIENWPDASCNPGDYTFAQNFQNYALNMEAVVRNQKNYNFATSLTVSERVFWKWMQKQGFMTFTKEDTGYYVDTDGSVVKGFGMIAAGAQRTDAYGIYNETFVQIPSSYGQTKVLFKPVADKNYYISNDEIGFKSDSSDGYIENINPSEVDDSGVLHTGISAYAEYDEGQSYFVNDETEELCAVLSLSELRKYCDDDTVNYDDICMRNVEAFYAGEESGNFKFNAVLVYYSIYDSTGKNVLATNAYGLLLLNSSEKNTDGQYEFKLLPKNKSDLLNTGNSYSFRLNIKTSSVYNGDVIVQDNSTPAYQMSTDFNETIRNLSVAVEVLRSNANLIASLCNQNNTIKQLVIKSLDQIDDIQKDITALKSGNMRELKVAALVADALAANTLDSSLKIGDHGTIDGSVLTYENIVAEKVNAGDAEVETITTETILGKDGEISFGEAGKINSHGVYSDNMFFKPVNNPGEGRMSNTTANNILNNVVPLDDGNFRVIDGNNVVDIGEPSDDEAEISNTMTGVNSKSLLAAIITKLNTLKIFEGANEEEIMQKLDDALSYGPAVEQNTSDIENLTSDVSTNIADVSTLKEDVSTNTADIEDLKEDVSTNIADISNIKDDVSTNVADIESLTARIEAIEEFLQIDFWKSKGCDTLDAAIDDKLS